MRHFIQPPLKWSAIASVLLLAACSPAGDAVPDQAAALPTSGQAAHSEGLYAANCASCHDSGAAGAPKRDAIERMAPRRILAALTSGVMQAQGAALAPVDRVLLSEYLGRNAALEVAEAGRRCDGRLRFAGRPLWNRWGNNLANTRFQPAAAAGISADQAPRLELAWAFAFPEAARARSQPAVTAEAVFTGSQSGRVYALDTQTGCIWWSYDAGAEVRSAPTIATDARGRPTRLYFGDFAGTVHAVDAATGEGIWRRSVRDHPDGTITGSVTLHDGRLFVPMSSTEIVSAINPDYACCTFRGGVTALAAADGRPLWRMHTTDAPRRVGATRVGTAIMAPSGAPVWSTPTVDARRGLIYVGTGENYSSPANHMSDAIIAIEAASGRVRWVRQTTSGDAWNGACGRVAGPNCPAEDGPDFDFGAPPMLVTLADGRDIILAGQKSGMVHALDPDREGAVLWQRRAGMGGFNGGIHWGMASDGRTLYVGIADTPGHTRPTGPPRPGLHAFDAATGRELWSRIEPLVCNELRHECMTALSAPVTLTPGIVFAGALNGRLMAYSSVDGRTLWQVETHRPFTAINGVEAAGGSIDSAGPVVAGGMLVVNSGYDKFGQIAGNVLLVYRIAGQENGR